MNTAQVKKRTKQVISRYGFAQRAYVKRMQQQKKKHSEMFAATLDAMSKECWTSISNMPIKAWWDIIEKTDLMFIMKEKRELTPIEINALRYIFKVLEDEKIKAFGLDATQLRIIELEQQMVDMIKLRVGEDDFQQETWIEICQLRIDELRGKSNKTASLMEIAISLERVLKLNTPIDVMVCSVEKFYTYIKLAEHE